MENSPEVPEDAPGGSRNRERVALFWMVLFGIVGMGIWYSWLVPRSRFVPSTKEKVAGKFAVEIGGAISSFYADYDRLPIDLPNVDWMGTTGDKNGLVPILVAAEGPEVKERNFKTINYLDGFMQAKSGDSGKMIHGIDYETNPLEPAIYDPWGQPFIVILDTDKDGVIANPLRSGGALPIRGKRGIVYSTGPPNADGSRNRDEAKFITSW